MALQVGYGAFPGGDPRDFTPDPECSTEMEREAHRRACAIYEAHGQLPPMDPDHIMLCDPETGALLMHIARSRFGLGVYGYDDGEPEARARARPQRERPMKCPSCGKSEMESETIHRCPACGDDYTGSVAAQVLDAHTESLRSSLSRERERADRAERERDEARKQRDELPAFILESHRNVQVPCVRCGGWGVRAYGSTATWRGGIGGQAITPDVCDRCWGSGDEHRRWPSHRAALAGSEGGDRG